MSSHVLDSSRWRFNRSMGHVNWANGAMGENAGAPWKSWFSGDAQEVYLLRVEYGLFNNLDAALVATLPSEQRPVAGLLLKYHADEEIIDQLGIDLHAIQITRIALIDLLRKHTPVLPYVTPPSDWEPLPTWPHVGPWWRFWGQPTPVVEGYVPCFRCNASYRLIWIEDKTTASRAIACPFCGGGLYAWQSARQYRIECVGRWSMGSPDRRR